MTLGNLSPFVVQTLRGDTYLDYEFLQLSCIFFGPNQ